MAGVTVIVNVAGGAHQAGIRSESIECSGSIVYSRIPCSCYPVVDVVGRSGMASPEQSGPQPTNEGVMAGVTVC